MAQTHILIVGAGVAGLTLAFWLAKAGFKITVVERTSAKKRMGQQIDINALAREIVTKMGLMEEVRSRTTGEKGFQIVNDHARPIIMFPGVLTNEIEITRGNLVDILASGASAAGDVEIRYEAVIEAVQQEEEAVTVRFRDGQESKFDAIVGADGMRSKIRRLQIDPTDQCLKSRDVYYAFCGIPREDGDAPYSRMQHTGKESSCFIRPVDQKVSSTVSFVVTKSPSLEKAVTQDRAAQKAAMAAYFDGVGGIAPRVVREMDATEDFYFERLTQTKLDTWSKGRCALVGDAAFAPSPMTGKGTDLAIIGAYVLAGELSEAPKDPCAAFKAYEARLRHYIEKSQEIPFGDSGLQRIMAPKNRFQVWVLRIMAWIIGWTGIWRLMKDDERETVKLELPAYPKLSGQMSG
jgi:2-polyprenyl-6-methoxyphenol hydroxylase-like FAD-dependent oxidoreductase